MPELNTTFTPATLLRSGAAAFTLLGTAITVWLVDKALRHPEVQASQFGHTAPLWIPAALFIVFSTAAGVFVLLRAARRVEAGDDLFAQRHRRRPGMDQKGRKKEQDPTR